MNAKRTLILGGGFGGIAAANTLRQLAPSEHEIVVIDKAPRFYVGAGKTWIMLGERNYDQISQSRSALLANGIRYVEADVERIQLAQRLVATSGGEFHWDFLVIALGADLNPGKLPGLSESAQTFYTVEGAERLRGELERFSVGDIAILISRLPFKCPPAPYEAAFLLQNAFEKRGLSGKVRLAIYTPEGAPMATAGPEMSQYIKGELARRSIGYFPQKVAARVDGTTRRILFEDGSDAKYDLLIAVPPHESPQVVRDAGLTNPAGWIPVNANTLQVQVPAEARQVYAVGDTTALPLPGRYKPDVPLALPKAGVFAEAHGRTVAHQIAAQLRNQAPDKTFDGKGFCYLETGAGRAVRADGSFFEMPHPMMQKREPDEAQFQDKLKWVENLLRPVR